jgi:hypothetical protein
MVAASQTKPSLPPTERDAKIYRLIVNDGVSTREAAAASGVSQTRVRQIVQRVVRWLAETLPAEHGDISPEAALRLAQCMAAERYQMFYSEAMNGWRQTGLAKYANLAFRATAAQARLPALLSTIDGLLADAISPDTAHEPPTNQQMTNDQGQVTSDCAPPPPIEDCSANSNCKSPLEKSPSAIPAVTSCEPKPSDQLPPAKQAARKALFASAEPLLTPSNQHATAKAATDDLGFEQILRRADRRGKQLSRAK